MLKVLIGYDGSECARGAIDNLQLAGLPKEVEALVISVADLVVVSPSEDVAKAFPAAAEQARLRAERAMAEAKSMAMSGSEHVRRFFPRWHISSDVLADSPYWGLVKKVDEWPADLLVVGSHGRSAVGRLLLGSVSQNAVIYASCIVRVGRSQEESTAGRVRPVRIMVGWDGSPGAQIATRAAGMREWPAGSKARFVIAVDLRLQTLIPPIVPVQKERNDRGPPIFEDNCRAFRENAWAAAQDLRARGVEVEELIVRHGDPKHVLLQEAQDWQADCIFVGAKGLSRIERVLLGSVSGSVAARAHCSVEVVRQLRRSASRDTDH